MNKQQNAEFSKLKTPKERAVYLLSIGVTAQVNIVDMDVVMQAKVGTALLPVTAETEALAIAKGIAWLKEKAEIATCAQEV